MFVLSGVSWLVNFLLSAILYRYWHCRYIWAFVKSLEEDVKVLWDESKEPHWVVHPTLHDQKSILKYNAHIMILSFR